MSMSQMQIAFDYSQLAPDVRQDVQEHTHRLHELERRTSETLLEMGERLDAVHSRVGRYRFREWLKCEFDWHEQLAYKMIQVYRVFKDGDYKIYNFAPSALYALASGGVPEEVRDDFKDITDAGRKVTHKDVQETLTDYRERDQRAARAEAGRADAVAFVRERYPEVYRDVDEVQAETVTQVVDGDTGEVAFPFPCDDCGKLFKVDVWHCDECGNHWQENPDYQDSDGANICMVCDGLYTPEEGRQYSVHPVTLSPTPPAMIKSTHVSHNSGQNEWYTPSHYIDAAREVMGGIDLDPASNDVSNAWIQASTFYTKDDNGLAKDWRGRVWMNPPYAQPLIQQFCEKVVASYVDGSVPEAIVLVNNATETRSFQFMAIECSAICFPKGRIRYLDESGKPANTPLQGQAFLYFGDRPERFADVFQKFGAVGKWVVE